jgi:hypothetical protein
MKRYSSILLAGALFSAALFSAACSHNSSPPQLDASPPDASKPAKAAVIYSPDVPPTRKQVLRALLDSQDVGLSTDSSCSGVGTEPGDANIGDYISGFLAEQNSDKGKNWLEIVTKSAPAQGAEPVWHCDVVIRHIDGDDRWGWGVSFLMKARDHSVIRSSFRCTGSG